jgi:Ternary complex associated domain 9
MQQNRKQPNTKTQASNQTPRAILWQNQSLDQLVLNLKICGKYIEPHTAFQHLISNELHDVLTHLFPSAQAVLIEPLAPGYSGTGVVKAQPFYTKKGGGRQFVVKFGDSAKIAKEYANYRKYVQHFVGNGQHTALLGRYQAAHIGGLVYSFLGTAVNQMRDFGAWYDSTHPLQTKQILDDLFRSTCGTWYANHGLLQPVNLTRTYLRQLGYTLEQLEQLAETSLPSVNFRSTLTFTSLHHTVASGFTNPFVALMTAQPFIRSTYVCTTHGDLNQHNILIDQHGSTWLIDFQSTEPGHILRDVAMLDTVLRFQLIRPEETTLDELLMMEKVLLGIKRFHQVEEQLSTGFPTTNTTLVRAYETVVHLRSLAHWLIEKNPEAEMCEYYIALLYTTLNTLRFSSLDTRQREYALLSASLLTDYLAQSKQ